MAPGGGAVLRHREALWIESAHSTGRHNFDYRMKDSGVIQLVNCHNP
ncbi:hypothetical protein [Corallococcus carmarthensis]|nr:hypothetical protein [Corallococcus carmarthensis]